ncbi:hypothetical protein SeMB42_g02524 [Synchytrium endobioticum]|uniref:BRCT domain-containing protein n=1 Tax=Synchytrium endobioticum TaxID=286115 RepID=A0A507DD81_9FUNG|nr:hypothetical protein SeMB42_g02524 [Synchytrium endobioticum]
MWFLQDRHQRTLKWIRPATDNALDRNGNITDRSTVVLARIKSEPTTEADMANLSKKPRVTIEMGNTRSETRVEGEVLRQSQVRDLYHGHIIEFLGHELQLVWKPVVALVSNNKQVLDSTVGIKRVGTYASICTVFIAEKWSPDRPTRKLMPCLASRLPVVTSDWVDEFLHVDVNNFQFPNVQDFLPAINEAENGSNRTATCLIPDDRRRCLFTSYSFVIFDARQGQKLTHIVVPCGGRVIDRSTDLADEDPVKAICRSCTSIQNPILIEPENDEFTSTVHRAVLAGAGQLADEFTVSYAIYDIDVNTVYRRDFVPPSVRALHPCQTEPSRSDLVIVEKDRDASTLFAYDTREAQTPSTRDQNVMDLDAEVPPTPAPKPRLARKVKPLEVDDYLAQLFADPESSPTTNPDARDATRPVKTKSFASLLGVQKPPAAASTPALVLVPETPPRASTSKRPAEDNADSLSNTAKRIKLPGAKTMPVEDKLALNAATPLVQATRTLGAKPPAPGHVAPRNCIDTAPKHTRHIKIADDGFSDDAPPPAARRGTHRGLFARAAARNTNTTQAYVHVQEDGQDIPEHSEDMRHVMTQMLFRPKPRQRPRPHAPGAAGVVNFKIFVSNLTLARQRLLHHGPPDTQRNGLIPVSKGKNGLMRMSLRADRRARTSPDTCKMAYGKGGGTDDELLDWLHDDEGDGPDAFRKRKLELRQDEWLVDDDIGRRMGGGSSSARTGVRR